MPVQDRNAVLEVINGYLASISVQPPFADAYKYIRPSSFAVISRPDKVWHFTLSNFVPHLEQMLARVYQAGLTCIIRIVGPTPDVWVHERFAAVWCGYVSDVSGKEVGRGVMAFTLVGGEDGAWKIVSVVDDQFKPGTEPSETVLGATPELVTPIRAFIRLLNKTEGANSDDAKTLVLSGGGVTILEAAGKLLTSKWEDSFVQLQSEFQASDEEVERSLSAGDGRSMGDLALVWLPAAPTSDSKARAGRSHVFTLIKKNGTWLISGFQSA